MGKNNFISGTKITTKRNRGFTLVELLLVIAVIGILAGITVMGYGAWRKNVAVSQLTSELNGVAGAMESARNFGSGYPLAIPTTFQPSGDVTLTYKNGDTKTYCIEATTIQDTSIIYKYDISQKAEPQSGGCTLPVPVVANLMHNPNPTSSTYWKPSATANLTVGFTTTAGYDSVRSTRVTTSAAALYGERTSGGVVTGSTGDQHTIMFTIVSPVTASVVFVVGYGNTASTTSLTGSDSTINLVANVPQTITRTITVPSGITAQPLYFKILWISGVGAIGDYFDTYKVMWVAGNYAGAYGDGYNTGAGWSWSGTANLSTSTGPTL